MHRSLIALLLLALLSAQTRADDGRHTFWEVRGKHNIVYMLGSVHMLQPGNSGLPPEALQAYARCKILVMEVDLNDAGADQLLSGGTEMETLPENQTLADALGPQLYAQFAAQAQPLGLDPEITSHFQPWFAALMLQQLEFAKSGLSAGAGVDEQFAQMAQADHKPIIGLETISEQLGLFAGLSLEQQRQFMRSTLEESSSTARETEEIISAWQHGDTVKLEQLLRQDAAESPELFRLLTVDRNRRWLPKITALLGGNDDVMVIVGALHLIGHDGVVELLRSEGFSAIQH
jgi:hypothetical protein